MRTATDISASCSDVVPYLCMCRWAIMAYRPTVVRPYNSSKLSGDGSRLGWPNRATPAGAHRQPSRSGQGAVGNDGTVDPADGDGVQGVSQVEFERASADSGVIDVLGV